MTHFSQLRKGTPSFPTSLDSTMISAYTECPQKFFMEYVLRLAAQGVSPDLHAGGAMASGFEAARKAFYFEGMSHEDAVVEGFAAFAKAWGDYIPPEGHAKDFITCGYALSEYFNKWPMHSDPLDPYRIPGPDNKPAVEFTFALPTEVPHPETGEPILYSGRLDLFAHLRDQQNKLAVVDEKTTKYLGATWYRKWAMRGQFMGYAYAAQALLGVPVEYAVVRGIALKKTEIEFNEVRVPLPEYLLKRWWIATNMKIREIAGRYRYMMARRQEMESFLDDAQMDEGEKFNQMNSVSHEPWTFAFGEPCEMFGGCSYKQNCLRQYPHLYYSDYDRRMWDPLAKNPTEGSELGMEQIPSTQLPDEAMHLLKGK